MNQPSGALRHPRPLQRLAVAAALCAAGAANAELIVGLTTTNALLSFDSSTPTLASAPVTISGLAFNERILGIDLRPADGLIYGLSTANKLYTLNALTGAASFVSTLSTPVASSVIGIDFNPVADRLRVIDGSGQSLRVNVATGAAIVDGAVNPGGYLIAASAYTNNDTNPATGTALYNLDAAGNQLTLQTPPNNGTQSVVGALGVDVTGVAGFDISGAGGTAYAALTDADTGKSSLYTISLASGAATLVGEFGIAGNTAIAPPLLDLTVSAVPEPGSVALMLAGLAAVGAISRRRRNAR